MKLAAAGSDRSARDNTVSTVTVGRHSIYQPEPTTVVVMGVTGVGKSELAHALAESTGATMAEGDDFHPEANLKKMSSGDALDDEDRWPWLQAIADWIGVQERAGNSSVVTCSALKGSYRDLLRAGHPSVRFCQLDASTETLTSRIGNRTNHYMAPSLLRSQLRTLEPLADDEPGGRVSAEGPVPQVLRRVLQMLADYDASADSRSNALRPAEQAQETEGGAAPF